MKAKIEITKGGRLYITNDEFFKDENVIKVIKRLNKSTISKVIDRNLRDIK
jgi:hypothetical protein